MKHSVVLEYNRCRGCTTCIKGCPTEAIRVRNGKAAILNVRCIDCGTCIRLCPHKAIKSVSDPLDGLSAFQYNIALPEPSLYGQFQNMDDIDLILNGLLEIGFHDVYEVAKGAELLSDYQRQCISSGSDCVMPQISSACPTVLHLIRMRFPKLIPNIAPVVTPVELSAILARREAAEKTGLKLEEIGVFSIVPCSAKVTASHSPSALAKPVLDGSFAIRDIYLRLLSPMKRLLDRELKPLSSAGIMGVGWACCGGESAARMGQRYVAVDGIQNVIRMLEEIEDGRLPEADFIELNACVQGCVGGCLTVENPYAARMRIKKLMKGLPVSRNRFTLQGADREIVNIDVELRHVPALVLDEDRAVAMEKLKKIQELEEQLPGLHCGSCGAPSCRAFAEDVVLGRASEEDCIFKMRERMQYMSGEGNPDEYLPAPFRQRQERQRRPTTTQNEEELP
ncbi:MAG TPA: [Fe-Fe] hydrogenase large subunit C-terminal domain-containing protein [Pseudoflavonifractor sp.]|nr:[Fe-Fe] hydrogenase large subunit C-terminal domain-containing protein [Pseudoflavonifractor sp.]